MTCSIRNFEKLNFTSKSSIFCSSQGQTSKYDRLAHTPRTRESMMVCQFSTLWQKFNCAVLTVCTVPMSTKTFTATGRHNESVLRLNNILRNLASRNAGRMILMDIEHELRAMDQARLTTDGIHFDSLEEQAWLNRIFRERLDEMEVELFDTGVLKKEETTNEPAISTFVS